MVKRNRRYTVVIWGRFPSLNDYIGANRQHKLKANNMKQSAQNEIIRCVKAQLGTLKIYKQVIINYKYYEPNQKRDLDNISGFFHKVFQDALVKCGVLINDSWRYVGGFSDRFYVDRLSPRIEVEIEEVE